MHTYECACAREHIQSAPRIHTPTETGVVMSLTATRTITASQRCPLVLRPPKLCDSTNQEQQLAPRGEDAGKTRGKRSESGSEGCFLLPARITSASDCLFLFVCFYVEQKKETIL